MFSPVVATQSQQAAVPDNQGENGRRHSLTISQSLAVQTGLAQQTDFISHTVGTLHLDYSIH